jgi:predicted amidohydrolase YtcJ
MHLVLINANVVTMTGSRRRCEAVAVRDERILAVGSSADVLAAGQCDSSVVVDLAGKTVLPGLIDSHTHAFLTGIHSISVHLGSATCVDEVCDAVRDEAQDTPPGRWIYGMDCSPYTLLEGRYPHRTQLDAAAPHNPVYIAGSSFHSGVANTRALELIAPDPCLPGMEKDSDTGSSTGAFLSDTGHFYAARRAYSYLSDEDIRSLYIATAARAASRGVTTLHCLDGQFVEHDRDVAVLLDVAPQLPVRTVLMYQTMNVNRVLELGLPRIGGCLTIDGAVFDHTACYYSAYEDDPRTRGELYMSPTAVREFVGKAHRAGLQIGMHAIGDKAIDVLVDAVAAAQASYPRDDCRHRVEHFTSPSDRAILKAGELGLALSMQPIFTGKWNAEYIHFLGEERASRSDDYRRLIGEGLKVAGGSDSPITEIDPLLGVHSAVNNPSPNRRVSTEQALRMFTTNGAWVAFEEDEKGTLEAGKLADLVVVDGDPFSDSTRIDELGVDLTMCGGKIVFSRPGVVRA